MAPSDGNKLTFLKTAHLLSCNLAYLPGFRMNTLSHFSYINIEEMGIETCFGNEYK